MLRIRIRICFGRQVRITTKEGKKISEETSLEVLATRIFILRAEGLNVRTFGRREDKKLQFLVKK